MDQMIVLIEQLKRRDYTSFDTFYQLTKNQVFYAIVSVVKDKNLAEDLMQDTYMKFLESINNFKEGSNVFAYLSRIGRNLAIDTYHQRKKIVQGDELFETIATPEVEEDRDDIFKMLDLLKDDEREIVTLHVINDLKFREISEMIDKPLGTVLWIFNKAMKKLKERAGDYL
jgi:RNA polymerase sigma-70 factor, ECF subfamily